MTTFVSPLFDDDLFDCKETPKKVEDLDGWKENWSAREMALEKADKTVEQDFSITQHELMLTPHERKGGGRSKADLVADEIVKLGKDLAGQIMDAPPGEAEITGGMRAVAASIAGLAGITPNKKPNAARVYLDDLVVGEMYMAHGWGGKRFDWVYLGMEGSRVMIKRYKQDCIAEDAGDHGLAAYASGTGVSIWHPTNWTESAFIKGKAVAMSTDINFDSTEGESDEFFST